MIRNSLRQKGAVLILTALALPMLICATGLAVDLGNIYFQRSRLQNAADAAAMAGAKTYDGKTIKSANDTAAKYITGTMHNLATDEDIHEPDCQLKTTDDAIYYRVEIKKDVPLYFLKIFYDKGSFTVPANSIAKIPTKQGFFNNMFIFSKGFSATNSMNNPDKLDPNNQLYAKDSKNMISTTFDGRIVYTNGNGKEDKDYQYDKLIYSELSSNLDRFFTSAAEKANKTQNINVLMDNSTKNQVKFNTDGTIQSGYWTRTSYYNYNFQTFIDYMKKTCANGTEATGQTVSTSSNLFKNNIIHIPHTGSIPNATINVDKSLGNSDEPVYIYIDAGMGVVNIDLSADTGRPLIICIDGSTTNNNTQVHFNLNGHTFKGVLYAPYVNSTEGILVNAGNSKFIGTIVGSYINLRGNTSSYAYQDFIGGNGGNTGNGNNPGVTLVNNPSGLNWD